MDDSSSGAQALGIIASAFERMNEFGRSLWQEKRSLKTTMSEHISQYRPGWKVAKYVETTLDVERGLTAAWAIELSFESGSWHIVTSTSISYGDYYKEVDILDAHGLDELKKRLEEAITNLSATMAPDAGFRVEIERLLS